MSNPLKIWTIIGGLTWLIFILFRLDFNPKSTDWVIAILLLAPLVLIPLTLHLIRPYGLLPTQMNWLLLVASLGLAATYAMPEHLSSAMLALPWLIGTIVAAGFSLRYLLLNWKKSDWSHLTICSSFLFLPIGAASALANRLGYEPLGFTPIIILLTAVHFHYAGFFLPIFTGLLFRKSGRGKKFDLTGIGILIGIPLVGLGITTTQLGILPWVETTSVTVLVLAALNVARLQLKKAYEVSSIWLFISALSLACGMLLAFAYGWRQYFPLPFLTIPWMYAVHGTLNSIGFAMTGIIGYWKISDTQ